MSGNVRKHTFVIFDFREIQFFAICEKTKGRLQKMTQLHKIWNRNADLIHQKKIQKRVHFTPILEKNPLFFDKFQKLFS